jgi:uncharacterized membrane protein
VDITFTKTFMKKFLNHVKSRVLAGLIFLIPVFAIILLLQKLWKVLTGAGDYLVKLFGLSGVFGSYSASVGTAVLLVLIIYVFGWLVKFSALNKMRDWLEQTLLQYMSMQKFGKDLPIEIKVAVGSA